MGLKLIWRKWMAKRNGRLDGKKGIPADDQEEHSPYEQTLIKEGDAAIHYVFEAWLHKDRKLKQHYCGAMTTLDNVLDRVKDMEPGHEDKRQHHVEYKRKWDKMHTVSKGYWVLFVFMAICEFPMNSVVFDILGEAKWLTYLLAAGLGVIIPLAAHFMGIKLRRESPLKHPKGAIKAFFLMLSVAAVLVGVAHLRERFVAGTASVIGIPMEPRIVTIIFLSINLLIFVVATLASYMAHMDVNDAEIREPQITRRVLKEADKLLRSSTGDLEDLKKKCDELEEEISRLKVRREKLHEEFQEVAENVCDTHEWLIGFYRASNLRARSSPKPPPCFKKKPEIDMSPFDALDEDCG
jgi:hypothetical protein